jgi:hypothetical protein
MVKSVWDETFRRVQPIHKPCGSSHARATRRDAETRSGVPERSGRESQQARSKARLKEKAESSYAAFRFRPRGNRNLERDFRFFVLLCGNLGIGQPLANDLLTQQTEPIRVIHRIILRCAIVESESLLVYVPEQMKGFDSNISSPESSLEQTPEIFNSLCVNIALYVLLKMIDDLMCVGLGEAVIVNELVSHNPSSGEYVVLDDLVHNLFLAAVSENRSADFAVALKHPHYNCLAVSALHTSAVTQTAALALVHVSRLATNVSLVNLYSVSTTTELAAVRLVLHPETDAMQHEPSSLLTNSERTVNLPRANSVLTIRNHPHHRQPLLKTKRRVLKHSPGLDAELRLRVPRLALPQAARRHKRNVLPATGRTGYTLRPAPQGQIVNAVIRTLEVDYCVC